MGAGENRGVRGWVVWGVAVLAYASAVLQRTTFGVAGVAAAERFSAPAGIVASFVVVQLVVYALMQIPVGVLLDRFGPRVMIATGALLMAMGQIVMASADTVAVGMVARFLVGAGDAMTFSSAVRLVPAWFSPRRVPLLTQLTGLLGQVGQIASAIPFAFALAGYGWSPAFLGAACVAVGASVTAGLVIRNGPVGAAQPAEDGGPISFRRGVLDTWRTPGTRLGIWTHYVTSFTAMTFVMMWGVPFLAAGEGLSTTAASALLTVHVLASVPCGPLFGELTQRYPYRRTNLVFFVVTATTLPWLLVLLWPGRAPMWALVLLVIGLAAGGPGSSIGFDFARTFNPAHRLGTATGLVIMGGFGGALIAITLIGVLLDVGERLLGLPPQEAYRLAMAVQIPMVALGIWGVVSTRRVIRSGFADDGIELDRFPAAVRRKFSARPRRER